MNCSRFKEKRSENNPVSVTQAQAADELSDDIKSLPVNESNNFCLECKISFSSSGNFYRHMKNKHPLMPRKQAKSTSSKFKCDICDTHFKKAWYLSRHNRTKHGVSKPPIACHRCPLCHDSFQRRLILDHFETNHGMIMESEELEFEKFEDFLSWKQGVEKTTKTLFRKERTNVVGDVKYHYFVCSRSGNFESKTQGIRRLKTEGTIKIDAHCPASIKVTEQAKFCVRFIKTHVGHTHDLSCLPLPSKDRGILGTNVALKRPYNAMIDDLKSRTDNDLDRVHLLTRKDLNNIEEPLDLSSAIVKHKNDAISLDAWVESMTMSDNKESLKYICNCPESAIRQNMCKHIHFLRRLIDGKSDNENVDPVQITRSGMTGELSETQESVVKVENDPAMNEKILQPLQKNTCKSDVRKKIADLEQNFHNIVQQFTTVEQINIMEKAVSTAKVKAMEVCEGASNVALVFNEEDNKNIDKQRRLYSPRKRKKITKNDLK